MQISPVSDQPLQVTWRWNAAESGIDTPLVQLTHVTSKGAGDSEAVPAVFQKQLELPPRSVRAVEVAPKN